MEVDPLYGRHIPDSEIEILKDPSIKVLFMVNPTNPTSTSLSEESLRKIGRFVREERKDLIVVTDAVYAALADGHRDIAAEIPANTIVLFSYSKYFGATGWRLGVVMMQEHNVADMLISRLEKKERTLADRRYGSVSGDPGSMSFIDRLVSDSRDVALVHTGGLSCPQQVLMCLFSLFGLMEENRTYKKQVQALLLRRKLNLYKGLGLDPPEDPHEINYYVLLDIPAVAESLHGKPFARFLKAHRSAEEYLLSLAGNRLTLCLPGRGFAAPAWCIRVALANLDDHVYIAVGKNIRDTLEEFYHQWKASKT
jgi:aspartate 4-decarboxylase